SPETASSSSSSASSSSSNASSSNTTGPASSSVGSGASVSGSGGSATASSVGSGGGTTSSVRTGGSRSFTCYDVVNDPDSLGCTAPDFAACACLGCSATCTDASGFPVSDCTCPSCSNDPDCADPSLCVDDGICDPLDEGCSCADCVGHPLCGA